MGILEIFEFNQAERFDFEVFCTGVQIGNMSVYIKKDDSAYEISKAYLAATPNATEIRVYKKGTLLMAHSNKQYKPGEATGLPTKPTTMTDKERKKLEDLNKRIMSAINGFYGEGVLPEIINHTTSNK